ncbi:hypothetical protein CN901_28035 [Bacillus cereus]|nr:hypothetical protein COM93_00220 [Bacillus cereus]PGK13754.1 hypothetical protein CN901_28035 [Bacillus cereus]RCL14855.1 hypothetical protein BLO02_023155 [Bacillus cereus]
MVCLFKCKKILLRILLKPINVLVIICTTIHLGEKYGMKIGGAKGISEMFRDGLKTKEINE